MDNSGLYCHKCLTGGQLCTPPGVENECRDNKFTVYGGLLCIVLIAVMAVVLVNVLGNIRNPFSRREPWQDLVDETDNYENSLKK